MTTPLQAAHKYVDICTVSLSERDFFSICAARVRVSNQTNQGEILSFSGREGVVKAFAEKVFTNTRAFDIKKVGYSSGNEGVAVYLDLNADKLSEEGKWVRTHFIERTYLTFEKVDGEFKLLSIDMKVEKALI